MKKDETEYYKCNSTDLCGTTSFGMNYCYCAKPHKHIYNNGEGVRHIEGYHCPAARAFVKCEKMTIAELAVYRLEGKK